jgi:hypothetical protein
MFNSERTSTTRIYSFYSLLRTAELFANLQQKGKKLIKGLVYPIAQTI